MKCLKKIMVKSIYFVKSNCGVPLEILCLEQRSVIQLSFIIQKHLAHRISIYIEADHNDHIAWTESSIPYDI